MSSDQDVGLTINQAASRLGVSENAVRQRIKRGTLSAVKVAGVWRVQLTDQQAGDQSATTTETTSNHQGDQSPLVEQLRSENARPWEELEARRDELRRRDVLVAQQQASISELAGRVQALSAGPEPTRAPQSSDSTSNSPDPHEGSDRAWWRFW